MWLNTQNAHTIIGNEYLQNKVIGRDKIHTISNMVIHPNFYLPSNDRTQVRTTLGFDIKKPLALVMYGGQGDTSMETLATQLQ